MDDTIDKVRAGPKAIKKDKTFTPRAGTNMTSGRQKKR
jgi:hypothetical protein